MNLSPESPEYLVDLSVALSLGDEPINGINYASSIVSGPGVSDEYDPDMRFRQLLGAGYWPEGGPDGHLYTAAVIGKSDVTAFSAHDERIFLRQLILNASIGATAMERYATYVDAVPELKAMKRAFGGFAVAETIDLCASRSAPFSYLVAGQVIRSGVISTGARVALLYYPYNVSPKTSLAHLRRIVREVELEEML